MIDEKTWLANCPTPLKKAAGGQEEAHHMDYERRKT
jgi:hypothetical protein